MLKIDGLRVNYGGIEAVKGISFDVAEGQIVTLIGANGAGKSTTLRTIAGLVKPAAGRIRLQAEDITGIAPDKPAPKTPCRAFLGRLQPFLKFLHQQIAQSL